ncbi:MAG: STAS domain-containing protein [Ignavibacteriales bacterium]|nr:STAS domain-containing protein [Ignavibacteriales bacterium]
MKTIKTMYEERFICHDDFKREVVRDLVVHKLNFTRATFKEAQQFRDIVIEDISSKNLKIIIDLSECDYIDSTFLGALVIVLKKIAEVGGEIKYVKPTASALALIKLTGLYSVFNLYHSAQDAIDSFEYPTIESL